MEYEECKNCPHKGQCDMQCYNEYNIWWTPNEGENDD